MVPKAGFEPAFNRKKVTMSNDYNPVLKASTNLVQR